MGFINSYLTGEMFCIREPAMTAGMFGQPQTLIPPQPPLIIKATPPKTSRPIPLMDMDVKNAGRRMSQASGSSRSSYDKVVKIYSDKNHNISTMRKWVHKKVKFKQKVSSEKYGH